MGIHNSSNVSESFAGKAKSTTPKNKADAIPTFADRNVLTVKKDEEAANTNKRYQIITLSASKMLHKSVVVESASVGIPRYAF